MAYEEYRLDRNTPPQGNALDRWFQRMLLACFPKRAAYAIYCMTINTIALFAKIGIYLILPFKAIQFFCQSWREISENKKSQPRQPENKP